MSRLAPEYAGLIIGAVTWAFFFVEAMIHYNMGAGAKMPSLQLFRPPPLRASLKIAMIVLVFSVLSATVSSMLVEYLEAE